MKTLIKIIASILFISFNIYTQQNVYELNLESLLRNLKSHDLNINEMPEKSFYESKSDWQYIIDTTWGPGLPLEDKQEIFNTFIAELEDEFDGFESLGLTPQTWATLKNDYYTKIADTTSRGRFSAIMSYFTMALRDWHTYAVDGVVFFTPMNPGVPLLHITGGGDWKHAGAVITVLPDSTIIVLRVANNHPLSLEPGDIILGYNGVKWIDLINELMEAELPITPQSGGSEVSHNYALLLGSIMNWHLFDTIDIVKYSTGDTLHLDVAPLASFNTSSMVNNEQIEIPGIPFPDYWNNEYITYGIIENTNIGYIYIFDHHDNQMNQKMFEAIDSLKNTDGLVIDMRYTFGGYIWNTWPEAFGILANETIYCMMDAFRCGPSNWNLCLTGDSVQTMINGKPPDKYERPIALLLGFVLSMGERNVHRLSSLENVRTFGKSTVASLGLSNAITQFNDWYLNYSKQDFALLSDLNYFLNRKEFPIDDPVWHNRDDVAQGKDAVVEAALDWMNNLVYGHNVATDNQYYSTENDTVYISATVENPNSNNVSARVFIENLDNTFIDSIDLAPTESSENWQGEWISPNVEDFYKLKIKTIDNTSGNTFSFSNMQRITTAGPVVVDSATITYDSVAKIYLVKPHLRNGGNTLTVENLKISMMSDDTAITYISGPIYVASIAPGQTVIPPGSCTVRVDSNFSLPFNFNFDISIDEWLYWKDSISIVTSVEDKNTLPVNYKLSQNYPNPFNSMTRIRYQIPELSLVTLRVYDVLGNEITSLVNDEKTVGNYQVGFDASSLSSGIYFYRLQAGEFVETKKMILLK